MFPLDNKEPYIKANGSRSTLGEMFDEAGAEVAQVKEALTDLTDYVTETGVKNFLPNNAVTDTIDGITFTVNSDGSVTATGTASADAKLELYANSSSSCPYNGYILSGCPSGGSDSKYDLRISDVTTGSIKDFGNGVTINVSDTGQWNVAIVIRNGQTVSNLVFRPMIRAASITDNTYQPYAKTNAKLTADNTIVDISDSFYSSLQSGITLYDVNMHKQGKHIFGNFVAKTDNVFGTTSTQILTLRHRPTKNINSYLATSKAQWGAQTLSLGYFYAESTGGLSVISYAQDDNFVKICLDYVTS